MMETGARLMDALRAGIRGKQVDWSDPWPEDCWQALFTLARQQHVLPLVVETVWPSPSFLALPEQLRKGIKGEVRGRIVAQTMANQALLRLFDAMTRADLHPVVMKGAACRSIYPMPEARPSSDEDILVPGAEFAAAIACLEGYGCRRMRENDSELDFEVSFFTPEGLQIELHRAPFAPDSEALKEANPFFEDAQERSVALDLQGGRVQIMCPHDHMLYLVLHAFKHLIHSGFGVRQVCDILLWGEAYADKIDWHRLKEQCSRFRAWEFLRAVYQIGEGYLGFGIPEMLQGNPGLGDALLDDLLTGGVFGGTQLSRKHSSTVTLGAVEAHRSGKKYSILRTLFPRRRDLEKRYSYLTRHPFLLPVAWGQRILHYGGERRDETNRAVDSLRIGKERTRLLQKLDIID